MNAHSTGGAAPLLVMIHHNRPDLTALAVMSLKRHTPQPHRLLLIDNASGHGLAGLAADVLLVNPRPLSFAANCNQGLARAAGRPVVLLNNDLYLPPGWLAGLMAGLEQGHAVVGAVSNFELPLDLPWPSGRLKLPAQVEPSALPPAAWPHLDQVLGDYNLRCLCRPARPRTFVSFYAVALAPVCLERLGGLDEAFVQGCEDLDYCLRAWRAGLSVAQTPAAYVVHFSGRATMADLPALAGRDRHNLPLLLRRWPVEMRAELAERWQGLGLAAEGGRLWDGLERRLAGLARQRQAA